MNHKNVQRLWRVEGLRVPQRRRRKRVGSSTIDAPTADTPNVAWAVDFQFHADEQNRPVKICSIVDEHNRECIGGHAERSITADRLTAHLEDLVAARGAPRCSDPTTGRSSSAKRWPTGPAPHRPVLHPSGLALARRIRRVIQQLLLATARTGRDRRLEGRVQPSPPAVARGHEAGELQRSRPRRCAPAGAVTSVRGGDEGQGRARRQLPRDEVAVAGVRGPG